jgi:hypothetical protein
MLVPALRRAHIMPVPVAAAHAEVPFGIQPSTDLADVLGARSVRGDSSADRQLCGIDGRLWRPTLTVANARYRHIPNDMRDEP